MRTLRVCLINAACITLPVASARRDSHSPAALPSHSLAFPRAPGLGSVHWAAQLHGNYMEQSAGFVQPSQGGNLMPQCLETQGRLGWPLICGVACANRHGSGAPTAPIEQLVTGQAMFIQAALVSSKGWVVRNCRNQTRDPFHSVPVLTRNNRHGNNRFQPRRGGNEQEALAAANLAAVK